MFSAVSEGRSEIVAEEAELRSGEVEVRYIDAGDDRHAISRIYEESWKYAYRGIIPQEYLDTIPAGKWAAVFDRPGWQTLVCLDDGKYIGTCSFGQSRFEQFPDCGEIFSLYLLPEYMGKAYGKRLLESALSELKARGFSEIFLWTLDENVRAKNFYARAGFLPTEDYLHDNIGGKTLRELRFVYKIL